MGDTWMFAVQDTLADKLIVVSIHSKRDFYFLKAKLFSVASAIVILSKILNTFRRPN
jgi:hypothetical protein